MSFSIEKLNLAGDIKDFHVRFKNIPDSQEVIIRDIRSAHLGKFIHFDGVVRQKSDVKPHVTSAKFECPSCGNVMNIIQTDHQKFLEPTQCGCGRKGSGRWSLFR